jgi:hypothetical protein
VTYGTVLHRERERVEKWMQIVSDTSIKPLIVQFSLVMSMVTDLWVGEDVSTRKKEIEKEKKESKKGERQIEREREG